MDYLITFIIVFLKIFIVSFILIRILHSDDENAWIRSLIFSISYALLGLLALNFALGGYIFSLIILFFIIMFVMKYDFSSAVFFLFGIEFVNYIVDFILNKIK